MLGIIGGSGLYVGLEGLADCQEMEHANDHGRLRYIRGKLRGTDMVFISRHRSQGRLLPPHMIDYRANMSALKELGAVRIIATATVGALVDDIEVGTTVVPDQYIDLTGEPWTFYDGGEDGLLHMDMTEPFCAGLRDLASASARELRMDVRVGGVYTCISGPQFETAAEARMLAGMGGTVAGMTVVPESKLARELGLCYQPLALVVNKTGERAPRISHENTVEVMQKHLPRMTGLLAEMAAGLDSRGGCTCARVPLVHR